MSNVVGGAGIGGDGGGADASNIPYASMYKTNGIAQTTPLTINTPVKATITTTAGALNMFTHAANTLTYVGSRDAFIVLSGCRLNEFSSPSPLDGIDENTLTIIPKSVSAVSQDVVLAYNYIDTL